jgi:YhcH/YjgK/YiaL family protein
MIVTDLEHAREQLEPSTTFHQALMFLNRADLSTLPDGTIEIDGKRVYASIQSYATFPSGTPFKFEAHREYIDFQYIVAGEETMGWTPANRIAFNTPYDTAGDIQFGVAPADATMVVRLRRGQLAVLFPSDGHAPRHAINAPMPVKKIVIKVAVR